MNKIKYRKESCNNMKFSVGVEYALHCMIYMVDMEESIGIKELAAFQGVSETYLSKIFTKLKKASIVRSATGVKGGYILAKPAESISFWDIIEAIEGSSYFFQCDEIRQKEILLDPKNIPKDFCETPCLIHSVMLEAEDKMREYLKNKSVAWLSQSLDGKIPEEYRVATKEWFSK